MSLPFLAFVVFLLALTAQRSQTVFNTAGQTVAPVGTLEALSETSFTTLSHPAFPHYAVRIKRTPFCDETVRAYTGYIDIAARHLFFYFFESRNDPDTDDVIFWTNGGPCRVINADNGTVFHPYSWNSNANIFFIDQPVGVGFSWAEYSETVSTSEEVAKDIATFIAIFFAYFKKFQGRGFHMAGESFGGRSVPVYAAAVYDQNALLVKAAIPPINISSVMLGNGMTDMPSMMPAWYEIQCSSASVAPVQDIRYVLVSYKQTLQQISIVDLVCCSTCVEMKARLSRCTKWMRGACQDQFDLISCGAATAFCWESMMDPYLATGLNLYDMTKKCGGGGLCYDEIDEITEYLKRKDVQTLLGVDPQVSQYDVCSSTIERDFTQTLDVVKGATDYVSALLERGVRVLVYVGTYDFGCNWIGNEAWTLTLEWSGHAEFVAQPLREWTVGGERAGQTRGAKGLTFATVDAAGHMAPYDKPKESLEMVNRWIAGQPL
ncbi:Carboxypeptidase [Mycena venus]|uniref:carboxypeptidase C n=1 Tax=Mycena venus TaxID=2733690 RepID=A0A8H6XPQ1_9AGAR|nr:Carboxypeptidase [Mycena venus]